ncbi:hypothetical protein D3C81_1463220 [compost metagenome]
MINHKGTQNIKTERLLLRKILPDDAEMVYLWMSDPDVCKYERWSPHQSIGYSHGYIVEVKKVLVERLYNGSRKSRNTLHVI